MTYATLSAEGGGVTPVARRGHLLIRGFRSIRELTVRLEPTLVVLGEDGVAESDVLAAIRCLVDPSVRPGARDLYRPDRPIEIELDDHLRRPIVRLTARPSADGLEVRRRWLSRAWAGPVLFLSASRRRALRFPDVLRKLMLADPVNSDSLDRLPAAQPSSRVRGSGSPLQLLAACEVCIACEINGAWILIEEPELYLGPQTQRALAELLRALAECGNQVIYSTHSAQLIDGRRPDAIVLLRRTADQELVARQAPHTPPSDVPDLVRRLASFDRERNAMFFARRVLLVEGASERLSLPFAFRLLGYEPDEEGVAIVDAGGKGNLPFMARTLRALGIPMVVIHDRDAPPGRMPPIEEVRLNGAIAAAVGRPNVVQLVPDFEAVSALPAHAKHKPSQAWLRYAKMREPGELPSAIVQAIRRLMYSSPGRADPPSKLS